MSTSTSLATNRTRRTSLLCLLYFCQGLPWGFATIALLAMLSQAGHPKSATAAVVAFAILPWTFKFFWAPMIDSIRMPSLGIRRPWIIIAQSCMALTLVTAVSTGEMENNSTITYIAWVFFVHNCFASLQDVATDALAIDLLEDRERGRVNGMMWGSKLFGIGIGGAGMATVMSSFGIHTAVMMQVGVLLSVLFLVIMWRERDGERLLPWTSGSQQGDIGKVTGLLVTGRELITALSTRTTAMLVLVALSMAISEGIYDPVTTEFFVQHLGWTATQYAQAQGTIGVGAEVSGALLGGFLCDRFGQRRIAVMGITLFMVTLLTFSLTASAWDEPWYPHVLLLPLFRGFFAMTTVSMFSLYMKVSWTTAAASQFTLYMAMNNLSYWFGASLVTWLEGASFPSSLADYYLLGGLLPLITVMLLFSFNPELRRADNQKESILAPVSQQG
jgi:PAT family beta-lactamase induction signal transducer AmpG